MLMFECRINGLCLVVRGYRLGRCCDGLQGTRKVVAPTRLPAGTSGYSGDCWRSRSSRPRLSLTLTSESLPVRFAKPFKAVNAKSAQELTAINLRFEDATEHDRGGAPPASALAETPSR
jgi:hypothetical protein